MINSVRSKEDLKTFSEVAAATKSEKSFQEKLGKQDFILRLYIF